VAQRQPQNKEFSDLAMFLNHIKPKIGKNLMFIGKTQCVL